jgi:hypothetical protein
MLRLVLMCYRVERIVCKLLIDIVMQTRHSVSRLGVLDRRGAKRFVKCSLDEGGALANLVKMEQRNL